MKNTKAKFNLKDEISTIRKELLFIPDVILIHYNGVNQAKIELIEELDGSNDFDIEDLNILEAFTIRLLYAQFPRWCKFEGSYGTINLNFKTGTIHFSHNERKICEDQVLKEILIPK